MQDSSLLVVFSETLWQWCHPLEVLGKWCVQERVLVRSCIDTPPTPTPAPPVTHGHAAAATAGIIYYMENAVMLQRHGIPTMCAIS